MKVIEDLHIWQELRAELAKTPLPSGVGFVPTMGALHRGHLSLIEKSVKENSVTVVSIYVNPTQFDNSDDLEKYPNTWEQDLELCRKAGVDFILRPTYPQLYPDDYRFKVTEEEFSKELCGKHRPGHFDGVLTVVLKLLNLVKADRSYFGEKDYQQLQLIKDMCRAFFITGEIVACPTVRENDGLAMSSRNVRLDEAQRQLAPIFQKVLRLKQSDYEIADQLQQAGFNVDYVESFNGRRFGAVKVGRHPQEIKLIDNVQI